MTLTFTANDGEYTVEGFREVNVFESFALYFDRVVTPLVADMPLVTTIRCSISGFPVATIHDSELADMVHHAIRTLKMNKLDDLLRAHSDQETIDAIETVIDHLIVRVTHLARPAPCLSYKADRVSEVVLSKTRQTSILLNQLLWDTGLFRDVQSSDEMYARRRKSFAIADVLIAKWDTFPELDEVHQLLVELDAKYLINKLRFSQREKAQLDKLRESHTLPVVELIDFLNFLIKQRDERLETELFPVRWSQEVYKDSLDYGANEILERSNVLQGPTQKEQAKAEARTPEGREKAAFKRAEQDRLAAAFAAGFMDGI